MAIRDQPYLALYVQDFMTDEKLINCSASSVGVYIRLMCFLHKCEEYGKVLLKQKFKQNAKPVENFALQFANILPYDIDVIRAAFYELLDENVIYIDDNMLYQKRMVKDSELSDKRAKNGSSGGKKTQSNNKNFASNFAKAKSKANSENEIDIDNEIKEDSKEGIGDKGGFKEGKGEKEVKEGESQKTYIIPEMWERWKQARPGYPADRKKDFEPIQQIGMFISEQQGIIWIPSNRTEIDQILEIWGHLALYIQSDAFFSNYSLKQVSVHIQSICQSYAKSRKKSTSEKIDQLHDHINSMFGGQK